MNKKGFTLIEIIAVIALLGIIIVIAVPAIASMRQTALKKEVETQINSIESAAVYYSQDTGVTGDITVQTLLQSGYLDPTYEFGNNECNEQVGCLVRPTDNVLLNNKTVQITKTNNKTKAEYQD